MVAESGYSPPIPTPSRNRNAERVTESDRSAVSNEAEDRTAPAITSESVIMNPFRRPICRKLRGGRVGECERVRMTQ